jgi:hypothetical protein
MQSVPITTKVVSWNPTQGEMSSIQLNPIKFVSDLGQVVGSVNCALYSTQKERKIFISHFFGI